MQHLDEDAELYALGLTGTDRVAEIEAHLAQCEECRARVAAAESVAAALSAALPAMPAAPQVASETNAAPVRAFARRGWFAPLAAAAALVFAATAAIEGSAAHVASARIAATDTALLAIASSHFGHTTLIADPGIVAKAIYARDGAWCYIVAEHAPPSAHVIVHRAGITRDIGALAGEAPATLFVRGAGRVERVEIVAGDHVVAHGVPVY